MGGRLELERESRSETGRARLFVLDVLNRGAISRTELITQLEPFCDPLAIQEVVNEMIQGGRIRERGTVVLEEFK